MSFFSSYVDVETVSAQKDVRCREGDSFVAVQKSVIESKGFHQRGGFFFDGLIVARLWAEGSGLNCGLIANAVDTAEHFDQLVLHSIGFRDRQVLAHLFSEPFQQIAIARDRFLKCIHDF